MEAQRKDSPWENRGLLQKEGRAVTRQRTEEWSTRHEQDSEMGKGTAEHRGWEKTGRLCPRPQAPALPWYRRTLPHCSSGLLSQMEVEEEEDDLTAKPPFHSKEKSPDSSPGVELGGRGRESGDRVPALVVSLAL